MSRLKTKGVLQLFRNNCLNQKRSTKTQRRDQSFKIILFLTCWLYLLAGTAKTQTHAASASDNNLSIAGFPLVLYQPETSLIFGGGSALTLRDVNDNAVDRPNNMNIFAIYSLKNQIVLEAEPDFYFHNDDIELKVIVYYQKFPDLFYGVGAHTTEADKENYTTEDFMFQPWLVGRIYKNLRIGMMYSVNKTAVLEKEAGGQLSRGDFIGADGFLISGMGPVIAWDTRDNIFYPSQGSWLKCYCTMYRDWLGSELQYESYTMDFRHYFKLADSHIVGIQLLGESLNGEIAFNKYSRLRHLRGVPANRFRDKKMLVAQIEYRYPIYKRLSGVAFTGIGDVMRDFDDFDSARLKYSAGLGLRFALIPQEGVNLRFDLGFSEYGFYPYFQLSEAF